MNGMLELQEDDVYFFDEASADRAVRFIETFCIHFKSPHAGKPFILAPEQRKIVRDLFGWKVRATGLRRFNKVYWEAAVGAGKSPLMAAIGLYSLIADGEKGGEIFSLASTFAQAKVVFEFAKKFAQQNPQLEQRLTIVDREIRHPASGSVWKLVSGKGPGAGANPSMGITDEAHDMTSSKAYDDIESRMSKRAQPIMFIATNSGESQASFCWQLRELAVAALEGKGDPGMYPVIWKADDDARTDDPAAWRAANPLIGITNSIEKVAAKCREAMKDRKEERKFRRLYLSIWPKQAAGRWLSMDLVDAAMAKPFNASDLREHPLYLALDLALCDDLCSAVSIWITPERAWLVPKFWLPRVTAQFYQQKEAFPYTDWGEAGHIELIDEPTISSAVHRRIADHVIGMRDTHKLQAVLYDAARAHESVALLEAAGVICVPMRQGWSVSQGCSDFERRLKERSISIAANPVFRFNCENAEVFQDQKGNIWPVKPGANLGTRYAGKRGLKIDGVSAAVTALTQARKHTFPAAVKKWQGFAAFTEPKKAPAA